jgi:beta-lactamase regulating signal transducer with metallopeptidase domain
MAASWRHRPASRATTIATVTSLLFVFIFFSASAWSAHCLPYKTKNNPEQRNFQKSEKKK